MAGTAPAIAWPFGATSDELDQRVASAQVLAVGAGGIGCELLKTLVLTGFRHIEVIDLDTIEVSNLNRQFLFRKHHVGHSKAQVAAEAVKRMRPDISITAHHGNVKDSTYNVDFFRRFQLVLNGLDNLDARRHVNRMCLAAGVPLVESGTAGYLGQVTVHVGGKTECFECQPKPVPKTFAICTIRNTPDKPIHCIEWARSHLLPRLFGAPEAEHDLDEVEDEEALGRGGGEGAAAFAERVFRRVFGSDVAKLAATEKMWEARRPPVPLDLSALLPNGAASPEQRAVSGTACKALGLTNPHSMWTAAENAAVFLESTRRVFDDRAQEVGSISFDKDDDLAVEFVTAASNLRSLCYSIPPQSLFDAKGMAGNIIHAIATTNAIISGLIVVEALKLLATSADTTACKATYLRQDVSNRRLLVPATCVEPNPACCVCGTAQLSLHIDTEATTLRELVDGVLKKRLGLVAPSIVAGDFVYEEGEGLEADEMQENEARLPVLMAQLPGGITHGTIMDVSDQMQEFNVSIVVTHQVEWDEEQHPERFTLTGSVPKAEAPKPAEAADGVAAAQEGPAGDSDGDIVEVVDEQEVAARRAKRKAREVEKAAEGGGKRAKLDGGDGDVIELLDDD